MNLFEKMKAVALYGLLVLFLTGCGGVVVDPNVQSVKNGTLKMQPNVAIGVVFDKFFENPQWKSFQATSGEKVVEFNGGCSFMEKPVKVALQFLMKDNEFDIGALEINGVPQHMLVKVALIEKIYSSYSGNGKQDAPNVAGKSVGAGTADDSSAKARYAFEMKDVNGNKYFVNIYSDNESSVDESKSSWFGTSRRVYQGEYFVSVFRNKDKTGGVQEMMLFKSAKPVISIFDLEDRDRRLNSAYVVSSNNSGQPDILVVSQRQAATSGWLTTFVIDGGRMQPLTFNYSSGEKSMKVESHTPFKSVAPMVYHSSGWSNAILESGVDRRGGIYRTWKLNLGAKTFEQIDERFVPFRQTQPEW